MIHALSTKYLVTTIVEDGQVIANVDIFPQTWGPPRFIILIPPLGLLCNFTRLMGSLWNYDELGGLCGKFYLISVILYLIYQKRIYNFFFLNLIIVLDVKYN